MKKLVISFIFITFISLSLFSQNYWGPKADLPGSSRYAAVGFSIDSLGYLLCGQVSSSSYSVDMWQFNPTTNSWVQKSNIPGPNIYGPSAFVINGIAYVGNGHLINGSNTNAFYKYNPSTNQWTSIASFPGSARYGCGFFVLNNKGYIFGGTTGSVYLKDLWEYNPATNQWTQKATLPGNERAHPVCFSIGNKAYMTSGKKTVGNYLNDTWEYNPSTNSWTQKGNISTFGRTVASGFAINGMGYCGCGVDPSGNELNDFWQFDPSTGQWSQIATIIEATGRHGASSFAINSKGYILTGLHGSIYKKDIWEYWPIQNTTISLTSANGSDNQTICVNNPITNITYATTGATGASISGLPTGVTGNFLNDTVTINGTPTQTGIFNYTVLLIGGTGNVTDSGTITVNACIGIKDVNRTQLSWSIYPNPNQGTFTIASQKSGTFELFDISGKLLRRYIIKKPKQIIHESLPEGVYFIHEKQTGLIQKLFIIK